jgi:hypothetical protein
VRRPSATHAVNARLGYPAHRLRADAAGRFQDHGPSVRIPQLVPHRNGLVERLGRHVVEQHDVGAGRQDGGELRE